MSRKSSIDVSALTINTASAPPSRTTLDSGPITDALRTLAQQSVTVSEDQVSPLTSKIRNTARVLGLAARVVFTVDVDGVETRINQAEIDREGSRDVKVYFRGKATDVPQG